jgi:hypothetical protein
MKINKEEESKNRMHRSNELFNKSAAMTNAVGVIRSCNAATADCISKMQSNDGNISQEMTGIYLTGLGLLGRIAQNNVNANASEKEAFDVFNNYGLVLIDDIMSKLKDKNVVIENLEKQIAEFKSFQNQAKGKK